jgi:hypothetical protein
VPPGRLSVELSHVQDTTSSLVDFGRSISLSDWHQAWSLGFFLSRFRAGFRGRFKIGRWRSRSLFKVGIRNRIHNNKVSGRISVLDLYFGRWLLGRWLNFSGVGFIILGVGLNFGRWLLIPGRWQGNLSSAGSLEASTAPLKGSSLQIHLPPFSLPFLPSFPLTSTRSVPSHLQARRRTPYQFKRRRETLSLAVPLAVQSSNGLHRVFLSSGWIGRGRR